MSYYLNRADMLASQINNRQVVAPCLDLPRKKEKTCVRPNDLSHQSTEIQTWISDFPFSTFFSTLNGSHGIYI